MRIRLSSHGSWQLISTIVGTAEGIVDLERWRLQQRRAMEGDTRLGPTVVTMVECNMTLHPYWWAVPVQWLTTPKFLVATVSVHTDQRGYNVEVHTRGGCILQYLLCKCCCWDHGVPPLTLCTRTGACVSTLIVYFTCRRLFS